jgi:hypothetical protein
VWWGTKKSAPLLDSIRKQITPGNFAAGEALLDKCLGEELCRAVCEPVLDVRGLIEPWPNGRGWPCQCVRGAADCQSAYPESGQPIPETHSAATSSKLPTEDRRSLQAGGRKNPVSDRSGLRLTEMEARPRAGFSLNPIENFPSGDSLIHFQHGLRVSEVLLSFDLGEVGELPMAVETGRTDTEVQGVGGVYETPFGRLRQEESRRPEWLSLDAPMPQPQPIAKISAGCMQKEP